MKISNLFWNCEWGVTYKETGHDVNYAFVERGNDLYIYFQGSSSVWDWARNFLFKKKPYKDMAIPYKVHRGFLAAWKEVEDIVIDKILEKKDKWDYRWKHITVVGYSHGAAIAGLCHECVWYWRPDLRESGFEGYGFEAPRFYGGFKVKKALRERWEKFTVVRTNNDLVTHCPPVLFRFCHVGSMLRVEGDVGLAPQKWYIPKCIKSHYPQVVYDTLVKFEKAVDE